MPRRKIKTPPEHLARQRAILEPLYLQRVADSKAEGREFSYTEGGHETHLSYDQFRRYITGKTLLPTTYYEAMAKTLRSSVEALRNALIPVQSDALRTQVTEAAGPRGLAGGEDGITYAAGVIAKLTPDRQQQALDALHRVAEATAQERANTGP